jgi:hypothetical protein
VKRIGPELKMPQLKAPAVLRDLYLDLRDRRLLPVIALVVVAIAAVPFLLGEEEKPPPPAALAPEGVEAEASSFTVVEATPGLRDYRKRLSSRTPTDPFEQKYTGPVLDGAELPEPADEGTSVGDSTAGEGGSSDGGSGSEVGESDDEVPEPEVDDSGPTRWFEWVIDVQISRTETTPDGRQRMGEPKVRRRVPALTPLPGEKAPALTTMGVNLAKRRVLFMVSDEVTSLFGESTCVSGVDSCQLVEVEPGFPLTLVYGPNEIRYHVKVVKVDIKWLQGPPGGSRAPRISQNFSK